MNQSSASHRGMILPFSCNRENDVRIASIGRKKLGMGNNHIGLFCRLDLKRCLIDRLHTCRTTMVNNLYINISLLPWLHLGVEINCALTSPRIFSFNDCLWKLLSVNGVIDKVRNRIYPIFASLNERRTAIARSRMHCGPGHMSRFSHMPTHSTDSHNQLRKTIRIMGSRRSHATNECNFMVFTHLGCQLANVSCRNSADLLRPFRSLSYAIISTEHIVLEVNVFLCIGRHMFGIEPDSTTVQKIPINEVLIAILVKHRIS